MEHPFILTPAPLVGGLEREEKVAPVEDATNKVLP